MVSDVEAGGTDAIALCTQIIAFVAIAAYCKGSTLQRYASFR